jgi:predicted metal-dependent enzyme (double-stranded beta helix superfamily)
VSILTTPTTSHPRLTQRATPAPTSRVAVDLPTLRRVTARRLVSAAHDLATDRDRWSHLVAYSTDERLAVRLGATDTYEAWLLTWLPGQTTGLHDHGGSTGAFVVVEGTLEEATLAPPRRHQPAALVHRTLGAGRARSFGPHHVHEVACRGSVPAVSLHLYGPALASMRRYVLDEDGRAVIVARERAGVDW